ncbi:hypothetical protein EYF80_010357 [Liparis tanakae]|uniref:Uncharacterized protein n=1 Tax=Liparis tanakae TaxID=230148 RepID=A0A4Z2IQ99_9TELE|nr:hypothetical protein EYF80_010357 [Liparis tanakae]
MSIRMMPLCGPELHCRSAGLSHISKNASSLTAAVIGSSGATPYRLPGESVSLRYRLRCCSSSQNKGFIAISSWPCARAPCTLTEPSVSRIMAAPKSGLPTGQFGQPQQSRLVLEEQPLGILKLSGGEGGQTSVEGAGLGSMRQGQDAAVVLGQVDAGQLAL